MNLEKTLIRFYRKSAKLDRANIKLKVLKKTDKKLTNPENPDISSVQLAIDRHVKLQKHIALVEKLGHEIREIQREAISLFKTIGFRGKKKICIEDERLGTVFFWYEATFLYFEKSA